METANYMILGFAVIFGVLLLHLGSLYWRKQNLQRDLEVLEKTQMRSRRTKKTKKKPSRR